MHYEISAARRFDRRSTTATKVTTTFLRRRPDQVTGNEPCHVLGGALRNSKWPHWPARRKQHLSHARFEDERRAESSRAEPLSGPMSSPLWGLALAEGLPIRRGRCGNTNYGGITRTSAFREMTGIERARLWSRSRSLARSSCSLLLDLRPAYRKRGSHIRLDFSLSPSLSPFDSSFYLSSPLSPSASFIPAVPRLRI